MMSAFLAREAGLPPIAVAIWTSESRSLDSSAERSSACEPKLMSTSFVVGLVAPPPGRNGAGWVRGCGSQPRVSRAHGGWVGRIRAADGEDADRPGTLAPIAR